MSDQWIRVSEITEYVYCHRSWWLRRMAGYQSGNVTELAQGATYHDDHGDVVMRSVVARRLAYVLLALAAAVILFSFMRGW